LALDSILRREELAGIERDLKAAPEGRVATEEQIEKFFNKQRPS
jgi:predicted transcriptional regulator